MYLTPETTPPAGSAPAVRRSVRFFVAALLMTHVFHSAAVAAMPFPQDLLDQAVAEGRADFAPVSSTNWPSAQSGRRLTPDAAARLAAFAAELR